MACPLSYSPASTCAPGISRCPRRLPPGSPEAGQAPAVLLAAATLVAFGIAVEFCLVYFGAELLTAAGLRTAQAATAMSGFYLGILSGRLGGRGLPAETADRSAAVRLPGHHRCRFLPFWLADARPRDRRLFLCGVGVANLYPLSLALTLAAASGNDDTANARTQLLGGVLVIAAPYLLGSLADHLGCTSRSPSSQHSSGPARSCSSPDSARI